VQEISAVVLLLALLKLEVACEKEFAALTNKLVSDWIHAGAFV
jgi:hypothetical protein